MKTKKKKSEKTALDVIADKLPKLKPGYSYRIFALNSKCCRSIEAMIWSDEFGTSLKAWHKFSDELGNVYYKWGDELDDKSNMEFSLVEPMSLVGERIQECMFTIDDDEEVFPFLKGK